MMKSNAIQAVLFDLDGTLRHNEPSGMSAIQGYLAELGVHVTPKQRRQAQNFSHYYWAISPALREDSRQFGMDTPAFWIRQSQRVLEAMDLTGDVAALAERLHERMANDYRPADVVPEDVRPTLAHLCELGYTLGLVSNRNEPLAQVVEELNFQGLFHFTLSAGEAGAWKPAPEIFWRALELADCPRHRAVYVGDNFYADIAGARQAGLRPLLLDPERVFAQPGCPVLNTIGEVPLTLLTFPVLEA